MPVYQELKPEILSDNGLNLLHVFNISALPHSIIDSLGLQQSKYQQLILVGHGGRKLWNFLPQTRPHPENRIDDFSQATITNWLNTAHPTLNYELVYPLSQTINLITLGQLAGWHHESPFKVGINSQWGTWFAYRAVILANSQFKVSPPFEPPSPCTSCQHKPCISHCPAGACESGSLNINTCINYRKQAESNCMNTCHARLSCPVQQKHRYTDAQLDYHYTESLKIINQFKL